MPNEIPSYDNRNPVQGRNFMPVMPNQTLFEPTHSGVSFQPAASYAASNFPRDVLESIRGQALNLAEKERAGAPFQDHVLHHVMTIIWDAL